MGRLILGVVVIVIAAIAFGTWLSWMNNHNTRFRLGLSGSKKRIAELQTDATKYRTALGDIKGVAETNKAIFNDPIWDLIIRRADEALHQEEETK